MEALDSESNPGETTEAELPDEQAEEEKLPPNEAVAEVPPPPAEEQAPEALLAEVPEGTQVPLRGLRF